MRKMTFSLFLVFSLVLAACGGSATTAAPPVTAVPASTAAAGETTAPATVAPVPAEPVSIEFWYSLTGDFGTLLEQLIQEYNASQDAVVVVPVYKGNYQDTQQALLAALAAGDGPAVSQLEVSFAGSLAAGEALRPVQDFINDPAIGLSAEEFAAIYPGFKEAVSLNGVMYSMPYNMSIPVVYYNADMLEAAGVAAPETWEDFAAAAAAVTNDQQFGFTINPGNVWIWEAMVYQNGGQMFSEDYSEVRFNEPPAVDALAFWADMAANGSARLQPWEEGRTAFFNGQVAFMQDSSGGLSGVLNNVNFELGVTHLPWSQKEAVTIGGASLGIFAGVPEEQQVAAWDFVRFLTAPGPMASFAADTGYVPISSTAQETEPLKSLLTSDPLRATVLESLPYAEPRPNVAGYAEIQSFLREAIEIAVLGQATPQVALDEAASDASRVLARR